MTIVSLILSVYLLIGILIMIFAVCVAKRHQLDISFEIVALGILVWFFSLPEIALLIWSTLKLAYWKERAKWSCRQIEKNQRELDKMMKKYEKEFMK